MKIRSLTYCSFAEPGKCLGVCILEGNITPIQASKKAWELKINPGGEVLVMSCKETDSDIPKEIFKKMWENLDRLIPAEEARDLFKAKSIREHNQELN